MPLPAAPRTPAEVGPAFHAALLGLDPARPVLVLGHFDADGLSAAALLQRALVRSGRAAEVWPIGKGESPWSPALRARIEARAPAGLIVADLGVRAEPVVCGRPTILVDHHVPRSWPGSQPGSPLAISGHGWEPEPTSSLLALWCARALGEADDLLWLAALGIVGDMAEDAGFTELAQAQARHGKTALREAVALVNAARRTAAADPSPALALLLRCGSPKELLRGGHPETEALRAAKVEVATALGAARRVPPKVRGEVALILFASPCQVHPLVAQAWRGRLKDKIVIAANSGYREGWVHFAARSLTGANLVDFLARHRPPGAGEEYGNGHAQATGGALRVADWNAFAAGLGFPDARIAPAEPR